MKRLVFWQLFVAALLLTSNSHAQSIKDLFNKENIEKAVNAVTGKSTADMTGTWSYTGSAIEFESDNLLQKAGGAVAATAAEKKLDEQLAKVGIKAGQMSFTFNADSTFSAKVGQKSMKGSYSYDASTQKVNLKFAKLIGMNAKVKRYLHNYGPAVRIGQATETDNLPLQQKQQLHSEEYRLAGQQLRRNDARILITETVTTTSIQQKNPASTEQCLRDFFI